MEGLIVVDTCSLFDFMGSRAQSGKIQQLLLNSQLAISVITIYELFRGVENARHIKQRKGLLSLCKILELTEPISRKSAEIYAELKKKGKLIPNQDILIAATALHWKYPIFTSNKKDFKRISGIVLV